MMLGGNSKLDFIVEKSFLEAVEATNLPRDQVVCLDICDTHPAVLGAPGSTTRRDVQEHWNNLKRRKIRSYANYLKRFGVEPSLTTVRLTLADTSVSDSEDSDGDQNAPPPPPQGGTGTETPSKKTTQTPKKVSTVKATSSVKKASAPTTQAADIAELFDKLSIVSPATRLPFSPVMSALSDLTAGSFKGSKANPSSHAKIADSSLLSTGRTPQSKSSMMICLWMLFFQSTFGRDESMINIMRE